MMKLKELLTEETYSDIHPGSYPGTWVDGDRFKYSVVKSSRVDEPNVDSIASSDFSTQLIDKAIDFLFSHSKDRESFSKNLKIISKKILSKEIDSISLLNKYLNSIIKESVISTNLIMESTINKNLYKRITNEINNLKRKVLRLNEKEIQHVNIRDIIRAIELIHKDFLKFNNLI